MAEASHSRLRRIVPVIVIAAALCSSGLSGNYGGGSGSAAEPYLIFTAQQLDAIAAEPNDWGKHFRLAADIDVNDFAQGRLHVIGVDEAGPFSGVFDGNDHTISGLGRHSPAGSGRAPLFGYVSGTVRGLGLMDPNVGGQLLYYTGALVADNHGVVANCFVEDANVVGGGWYAGGLVGRNDGTIIDCHSSGVVRDRCVGGLVGVNRGTITGCHSAATVVGDALAGGLAAENLNGTVVNCGSTAMVTGDDRTGGLIGYNSSGALTCCRSTAVVVGNDGVGGLVGENWQGSIIDCYSAAVVTGDRLTAGLVGNNGGGVITNCYATGPVWGRWPAGGLVAFRHDDDVVSGSFWDMDATGCPWSAAGDGKSTAEMQTADTFLAAGWDFLGETANGDNDIWSILEGQDYPRLHWESPEEP